MSPLAFTSWAPKAWNRAPALSTLSDVWPRPMPNGLPPFWQASAALRKLSRFQASALGAPPAGYIAWMSMPACFFSRSMREHGPLIWLPEVAGTASHLPFTLPRYSTVPLTAPFSLMSGSMMSFIGTSWSA